MVLEMRKQVSGETEGLDTSEAAPQVPLQPMPQPNATAEGAKAEAEAPMAWTVDELFDLFPEDYMDAGAKAALRERFNERQEKKRRSEV